MAEHISVTFTQSHGDLHVNVTRLYKLVTSGGKWHAIVGRHFGSSVSPEATCFTYFDIHDGNEVYVSLYCCTHSCYAAGLVCTFVESMGRSQWKGINLWDSWL